MSTNTPPAGVPPAPAAAPATPKKGFPVWAWVLLGCGTMALIATIIAAVVLFFAVKKTKEIAAEIAEDPTTLIETIIDHHPDLELVELDSDAGTVTVRVIDTGEEITVDFDDITQGRLRISSGDKEISIEGDGQTGTFTITGDDGEQGSFAAAIGGDGLAGAPGWLPVYPGATAAGTYSARTASGLSGGFVLTTDAALETVLQHGREQLEQRGFAVEVSTTQAKQDGTGATLHAEHRASDRAAQLIISEENGTTSVVVTYSEGGAPPEHDTDTNADADEDTGPDSSADSGQ